MATPDGNKDVMLETLRGDRYQLVRVLGSGGFGQTFVAVDRHQSAAASCVIKQFKPVSQDMVFLEVARRLFFSEVEVLRKLGGYDRIPTLLDEFEEDGQFYLVQEHIEGRSLQEELAIYRKLTETEVLGVLRDVLEILEFVHQNNVIHRDIKPSNLIRRQRDRRLVLIDFGAVKEIATQVVTGGEPDLTVGIATQGYGPTEQLAGKPRFNSDLYALGMTAIQALTGLHPSQLPTHPVTAEVIWRDRADVSPWLAAILDKLVRYHFNQRFQSATEALEALQQTAMVQPTDVQLGQDATDETAIPPTHLGLMATAMIGDSGLGQADAADATTLYQPRRRWARGTALMASAVAIAVTLGLRQFSWLQPLELAAYDRLVQTLPDPGPDPRLLVVGITEADIQAQRRFPLSDATIAQTLQQLQQHNPRVIGLDIFRDLPQEPGRQALLTALQRPNVVAIANLESPLTPAPPEVPPNQVGFNDVPLDEDSVVRRNLVFGDVPDHPDIFYSLSLRVALRYLKPEGISLTSSPQNPEIAQLGPAVLTPLTAQAGGYQKMDAKGYQLLLQYRGRQAATQVSLGDVLQGKLTAAQVKDKVVLIGTTAANAKDLFFTPYSPLESPPRLPGVMLHAHMVSQWLDYATGQRQPLWFWSEVQESLWIGAWALLAGGLGAWLGRRSLLLVGAELGVILLLGGSGLVLFRFNGWVPIAAPATAVVLTTTSILVLQQTQASTTQKKF